MTAVQKGKRNEKKTKEFLEKEDKYQVENTKSSSSYRNVDGKVSFRKSNNDFFGLWDHICLSRTYNIHRLDGTINSDGSVTDGEIFYHIEQGETLFVQTKSNRHPNYFGKKERMEWVSSIAKHKFYLSWEDRKRIPKIYLIKHEQNNEIR